MSEQEREQYWREFYTDVDATIAEWREQYDPDGEMDLLELIETASAGGD